MRIQFYSIMPSGKPHRKVLAERDWPVVPREGEAVMLRLGSDEFHGVVLGVQWGDVRGKKAPIAIVAVEPQP